jgi:hypothetical protein
MGGFLYILDALSTEGHLRRTVVRHRSSGGGNRFCRASAADSVGDIEDEGAGDEFDGGEGEKGGRPIDSVSMRMTRVVSWG